MRYSFVIPVGEHRWSYSLSLLDRPFHIFHDGVIYLTIIKHHDHRYEMFGFIFSSAYYIYPSIYKTKLELYGALQKLLQEKLYVDIQS